MSKRKGDDDIYNETLGNALKSTRSYLTLNSYNRVDDISSQFTSPFEGPSLIDSIQNLLKLIFAFKCENIDNAIIKEQSLILSQQIGITPTEIKRLKYTNQIIEIPLYPKPINIKYNSNFPFIREPMSLSVQCDKFITNPEKYQTFNKIILKNSTIVPLMHTLQLSKNINSHLAFTINCYIVSQNNTSIIAELNEAVFDAANIMFESPEMWTFGYRYINFDTELRDADKVLLISEYWRNFKLLFCEMTNLDLVVSVKHDKVRILNILHHHFTL